MNREEAELIGARIKNDDATITGSKVKNISMSMVVHRHATGKDEDIGLVSYYSSNPFKHYYINFKIWLRGKYRLWRQY